MNIGHVSGVWNSKLLNAYTLTDPCVKPLIMLVKYWAKRRDLNDPSVKSTDLFYIIVSISSYSYSLMVIGFLLHKKIIPNIQKDTEPKYIHVPKPSRSRHDKRPNGMRKLDVSFHTPTPTISSNVGSLWEIGGVPSLFYEFMRYYGHEHIYSSTNHIDIKEGGVIAGKGDSRGILVNYYLT
jgi:DNA polymerase sigma